MKPLLIGLSGKAGSGKSTVANYLEDRHRYAQFAFANALKDTVGLAFGFSREQLYGSHKEFVDRRWGVSPRWCLQWLGTEILRDRWPDIWFRHLRRDILDYLSINGQRPVVVSDVRFRDEAQALKNMGAVLIRIERPGCPGEIGGFDFSHISETDLDDWDGFDHVIHNDGTLKELFFTLDQEVLA